MHAPHGEFFPEARTKGLLVERVGDETIVYDTAGDRVHCLSPLAAAVFSRCDGHSSVAVIAQLVSADTGEAAAVDQVEAALAQLEANELLETPPGDGTSRRELLRDAAIVTTAAGAPRCARCFDRYAGVRSDRQLPDRRCVHRAGLQLRSQPPRRHVQMRPV